MRASWIALPLLFTTPVSAAATWSFEGSLGAAYHPSSRLTVEQEGEERLSFKAKYATRSFESPPYYALRVSRWHNNRAWELSLIHDKLYVRNPPADVEHLAISHGFNLLTVNRALQSAHFTYRLGLGPIITHPEGRVRGESYDGPYDLAGIVALAGVSKRIYLNKRGFLVGDGAVTLGYATTTADGTRDLTMKVRYAGVHALLGVGWDF